MNERYGSDATEIQEGQDMSEIIGITEDPKPYLPEDLRLKGWEILFPPASIPRLLRMLRDMIKNNGRKNEETKKNDERDDLFPFLVTSEGEWPYSLVRRAYSNMGYENVPFKVIKETPPSFFGAVSEGKKFEPFKSMSFEGMNINAGDTVIINRVELEKYAKQHLSNLQPTPEAAPLPPVENPESFTKFKEIQSGKYLIKDILEPLLKGRWYSPLEFWRQGGESQYGGYYNHIIQNYLCLQKTPNGPKLQLPPLHLRDEEKAKYDGQNTFYNTLSPWWKIYYNEEAIKKYCKDQEIRRRPHLTVRDKLYSPEQEKIVVQRLGYHGEYADIARPDYLKGETTTLCSLTAVEMGYKCGIPLNEGDARDLVSSLSEKKLKNRKEFIDAGVLTKGKKGKDKARTSKHALTRPEFQKNIPPNANYIDIFSEARTKGHKHRAFGYRNGEWKWYVFDPYTYTKMWHIPMEDYFKGKSGEKPRIVYKIFPYQGKYPAKIKEWTIV